MNAMFALAMKDIRLLLRDRANAFFTFVFPLLVAVFFGSIFGGGGGGGRMDVAVADLDGGKAAAAFIADLSAADGLTVTKVATRDDGVTLVRKGSMDALVIVPKGFEESAGNMFGGGGMKIEAVVDPKRTAEAGLLTGKLNEIGFMQMSRSFADPKRMSEQLDRARKSINDAPDIDAGQKTLFGLFFTALDKLVASGAAAPEAGKGESDKGKQVSWRPVEVNVHKLEVVPNRPQSSYDLSFSQGVVWGLMGCVTAFGLSLIFERTHGTLMRLTTSPLSRSTILLGKALACFLSCIFVQVLLLVFAVAFFNVRINQPLLMVPTILMTSFGFVGVMMLMAGLCRSEGAGAGMGRALVLILAMVGGGTIPVMFMPAWLNTASGISPFKWATDAIDGAIWRATWIGDLALPFAVLGAMGVVGYILGAMAFRMGDSK